MDICIGVSKSIVIAAVVVIVAIGGFAGYALMRRGKNLNTRLLLSPLLHQ